MKQENRASAQDTTLLCAAMVAEHPHLLLKPSRRSESRSRPFQTSYGLAESCVYVASSTHTQIKVLDGIVSCGYIPRCERYGKFIKIAGEDGTVLEDGDVGEIFLRGFDIASGYWAKPDLDGTFRKQLSDGHTYMETGDLGKIVDNRLYVMGRKKEVIIVNGKNYYATDLERTVESEFQDVVRPGSSVAYQVDDVTVGLAIEVRKTVNLQDASDAAFVAKIRQLIGNAHGVNVSRLDILVQGTVPKTTSGKLRRVETRRLSLADEWKSKAVLVKWLGSDYGKPEDVPSLEPPSVSHNDRSPDLELGARGFDKLSASGESDDKIERVFVSVLGTGVDLDSSWLQSGISSVQEAELAYQVSEKLLVQLPPDFTRLYPTIRESQAFVRSQSLVRRPFEVNSMCDERSGEKSVSMLASSAAVLQAVGISLIIFTLSATLVTTFFIGKILTGFTESFEIGSTGRSVTWTWLPLTVPGFFLSLSLAVVGLKWLVVGRYRNNVQVQLPSSMYYLRWWFVDRLMDVWELLVGQFLLDTKFVWLFYWLLGAKIDWTAKINAFVREFDLVTIGAGSSIKHQIRCRKFVHSEGGGKPSLRFRSISVGDNCTIRGMLGPGVCVGNGSEITKLSSVVEGAQVPDGSIAKGSPAYNAGVTETPLECHRYRELTFEVIKMLWLLFELYHFYGMFLVAQIVINDQLPSGWRYDTLLYWALAVLTTSLFGLVTSVLLKWVLIGRRRAHQSSNSLSQDVRFWVCDYHFQTSCWALMTFLGQSKLCHAVLFLHGLDIDISSYVSGGWRGNLVPSKLDLIKIRKSFMPTASIDVDGQAGKVEINQSTLGFNVHLTPGVQIVRSVIPPRVTVEEDCIDSIQEGSDDIGSSKMNGTWELVTSVVVNELLQCVLSGFVLLSFVPSFELFMATAYHAPVAWVGIFGLCGAIVLQTLTWTLLGNFAEFVTLLCPPGVQVKIFPLYINFVFLSRPWGMSFLLYGTPFMKYWLKVMGASVDGEIWYFGSSIYELRKLHFANETVVDNAHVAGHLGFVGKVTIDDTYVSGVLHPGCYASAGAIIEGEDSGPWKVFMSSGKQSSRTQQMSDTSDDDEEGGALMASHESDGGEERGSVKSFMERKVTHQQLLTNETDELDDTCSEMSYQC